MHLREYFGEGERMLSELECASNKVVGTKQVLKALEGNTAKKVFVAEDIDPDLRAKLINAASAANCDLCSIQSMKELGKACGIQVGAAAAAILK